MAAKVIQVAEAVQAALNAGGFSQSFTAVRAYRPEVNLTELKSLRVTVVPKTAEREFAGRTVQDRAFGIDVAVQKKLSAGDAGIAEADALMLLAEEMADALVGKRLPAMDTAVVTGVRTEPLWSPEHLAECQALTVVQTFEVKVLE